MNIQTLFGEVPLSTFVREYLHRLPFALPETAMRVCEFGSWDKLETLLASDGADVRAARDGSWHTGQPPRNRAAAQALCDERYTIVMRHAERHHPDLAEVAAAFGATFLGPVDIQVFVTPPGSRGFSWHYDAEDVFILQTAGAKEYSLRKNTVNPWPLEETLPDDMQYERELMPLSRVLLRAGDMLYIPCGYWHKAEVKDAETAISLAVGVMSPSALEVYGFLRARLVRSLVWRQRLPMLWDEASTSANEIEVIYRHLFAQLAREMADVFDDARLVPDFIEEFFAVRRRELLGAAVESDRGVELGE